MAASRRVQVSVPPDQGAEYEVVIGTGLLAEAAARLGPFLGAGPVFIVSDATVQTLYGEAVTDALGAAGYECVNLVMAPGEASKSRDVAAAMQDTMLSVAVDRDSRVLALGGGVPGDVGGYLAATLLRGVPWLQVPTTLLAMVDSSVGGKTGLDTAAGKNLIGAFWQPTTVLADVDTLVTLPDVELAAGLAEVIKYGVVLEEQLFTDLEDGLLESCLARVPEALAMIIERCVGCKATVVAEDAREANRRQVLNFGHTIGHGIEAATGYAVRHGDAVAIGMVAAARLSGNRLRGAGDLAARISDLCIRAGLPVALPAGLEPEAVVAAAQNDKKGAAGDLRCVLVSELGRAANDDGNWSHGISTEELIEALA
jgi:3-dehydroquinate synthase